MKILKLHVWKISFGLVMSVYVIRWVVGPTPSQLDVSVVKDKIQVGLTATSILLPACVVILLFLLEKEKYKEFPKFIKNFEKILDSFFAALWWLGISLLLGVWNLVRLPMAAQFTCITDSSEIIWTGLFGAAQFWCLFFGVLRLLLGGYSIKKNVGQKTAVENIQPSESTDKETTAEELHEG